MPTYRLQLQLRSGLATPLAADTLWGHIAWGIRYVDGEPALKAWLQAHEADQPPLVLSDPMPAGFLPRPVLPPTPRPRQAPPPHQADRHKRLRKQSWISRQAWNTIHHELEPAALEHALDQAATPPASVKTLRNRAAINRLTCGTLQPGDIGTLFTERQHHYVQPQENTPASFDVFAHSPEPAETVATWFRHGLRGGYGKRAAIGLGELHVLEIHNADLPTPQNLNAAMLLGPAVPHPDDPARGFFQFAVRCGRVGGDFATGPLPDGSFTRQKRPVTTIQAGSIICLDHFRPTFGRMVHGVHDCPDIVHNGRSLLLPCRLGEQICRDPLLEAASARSFA